jgi:hypothetical protein
MTHDARSTLPTSNTDEPKGARWRVASCDVDGGGGMRGCGRGRGGCGRRSTRTQYAYLPGRIARLLEPGLPKLCSNRTICSLLCTWQNAIHRLILLLIRVPHSAPNFEGLSMAQTTHTSMTRAARHTGAWSAGGFGFNPYPANES